MKRSELNKTSYSCNQNMYLIFVNPLDQIAIQSIILYFGFYILSKVSWPKQFETNSFLYSLCRKNQKKSANKSPSQKISIVHIVISPSFHSRDWLFFEESVCTVYLFFHFFYLYPIQERQETRMKVFLFCVIKLSEQ